ncbi:MAG: hypothetical protein ACI8UO_000459 [Verrucomicrobiales bacterium]|jgi:hypothetical protein
MKTPLLLLPLLFAATALVAEPIEIGNRLELFVDDHLIAGIDGDAGQQLLRPDPKEVVLVTDSAWEGNTSGYYGVFRDGDTYKMVYRGWRHDEKMKATHPEVTCYAESTDGIKWTKPNLGLFEWEGSKENNIIWLGPGCHNFTAILDENPDAPADARFKALGGSDGKGGLSRGLLPFSSPDCKNWRIAHDDSVITNGAFDSQNLAFWDTDRKEYRAYWRYFSKDTRVRAIRTATSKDFINWENEADLAYVEGTPEQHLYTNAIQKYFRAPHLFVGFPTRYLPKQGQRVEPILMTSRDGVLFHRWNEAVIPEEAPKDRKGNRSNYMTWGMFQLPGKPKEVSVYATENYYERTPGRVRRFAYRVDGFVALRGGDKGGAVITKALKYSGQQLLMNYVVREGGSLTVEALDEAGKIIGKSKPLTGDAVDSAVEWAQDPKLGKGALKLRFALKNADVFSIRFQ